MALNANADLYDRYYVDKMQLSWPQQTLPINVMKNCIVYIVMND